VGLARVVAEIPNFEIAVSGVERIAERWERLRGSLGAQHPLIPRHARQAIGLFRSLLGSLGRRADRGAIVYSLDLKPIRPCCGEAVEIGKPLPVGMWLAEARFVVAEIYVVEGRRSMPRTRNEIATNCVKRLEQSLPKNR
jgi:hypothetical protein